MMLMVALFVLECWNHVALAPPFFNYRLKSPFLYLKRIGMKASCPKSALKYAGKNQ